MKTRIKLLIFGLLFIGLLFIASCEKQPCKKPQFDGRFFVSTEGIVGCGVDITRLNFEFESNNSYYLFAEKRGWAGLKINNNYSQSYQQPEQIITICRKQNQEDGSCIDKIITIAIGCDWCYYFEEINGSLEQREQGGTDCLSPEHLQVIDMLKERYK